MKCIILIAAPAAGKGTISKYIEDKYNYKHISTGDLLRKEIKNNTNIGKKIKSILDKGSLVGDDIIKEVFEKEFKKTKSNIILLLVFNSSLRRTSSIILSPTSDPFKSNGSITLPISVLFLTSSLNRSPVEICL